MSYLRHKELTYELRGLVFEVRNNLKAGWSEEVYHQALVQLARSKGIPVQSKPRRTIWHRGVEVNVFECDLILWNLIIAELKVLPFSGFASVHHAQLIHYLKCWNKDLGVLVDFAPSHVRIERLVWDEADVIIEEDYDLIKMDMTETDRACLRQVRQSILAIARQYGLGYPGTVYRRIAAIELAHNGLNCEMGVVIPATWDGHILAQHSTDLLLVEDSYLLNVCALLDYPGRYEYARTKTFLNSLGLRFGLIVNFGKRKLQIFGVNAD